jgi:hypothetical protein
LRIYTSANLDPFKSYFELSSPIQSRPGYYILEMYTLINCQDENCKAAQDAITILIKDGADSEFSTVCSVLNRFLDERWYKLEFCKFPITKQEFWV